MLTIQSDAFSSDPEAWIRRAVSEPVQIRSPSSADVVVLSAEEYSSLVTSRMLRRLPRKAA
jgi:PHD/YefM family antitoxin component YafN of YafNO toxin-antitoxin module